MSAQQTEAQPATPFFIDGRGANWQMFKQTAPSLQMGAVQKCP